MKRNRFLFVIVASLIIIAAVSGGFIHRLPEDAIIDHRCIDLGSVPPEYVDAANRKAYASWRLWARLAGWNP